jgi:hypothetical protein
MARAVHSNLSKEDIMPRKDEKYQNEQIQLAEHERHVAELVDKVDAVAASEAAYVERMSSADAPAWAKVTVRPTMVAAPATREDIVARLSALDAEQTEVRAKLDKSIEEQRAILNQQLADQAAAEDKIVAARELPNQLKATLQAVNEFVLGEEPTFAGDPFDAAAQRGQDALARAMRRLRGENVPEPESVETATSEPKLSTRQATLMGRIEPAQANASEMKAKLSEWTQAFGNEFNSLYVVGEDDANREHKLTSDLMRGLPSTTAELQTRSFQLVKGVLAGVRLAVQIKSRLVNTVDSETQVLNRLLAKVDRMGPMRVQGDFSAAHYDLERELQTTLLALATVSNDSIAGLWTITKDVAEKLAKITTLRASVAGQPQPPLVWESRGAILDGARQAERMESSDWERAANMPLYRKSTLPSVAVTGGPFDAPKGA